MTRKSLHGPRQGRHTRPIQTNLRYPSACTVNSCRSDLLLPACLKYLWVHEAHAPHLSPFLQHFETHNETGRLRPVPWSTDTTTRVGLDNMVRYLQWAGANFPGLNHAKKAAELVSTQMNHLSMLLLLQHAALQSIWLPGIQRGCSFFAEFIHTLKV